MTCDQEISIGDARGMMQEKTVEAMKEEISASYQSFIRASTEIKKMESSMAELKTLVVDCKRSLLSLKHASSDLRGITHRTWTPPL